MEDTNKGLHENETSDDHQTDTPLPTEEDITNKIDEIKSAFNQVSKVITEVGQWSESTAQLFYLEVQRNIAAAKQSIICQVLFIPLLILFIFSLCISIGVVAYVLTQNVLIGIGLFLFAMGLILAGLIYWQKRLIRSFGFNETISQLKEGVDVITKAAQSRD
ncbi:phage holin family protein [Vibrio hibernica]|uniref:phage holin family protein n=1 Tax=Vibrio hibernica TaxID=2587465 RepID=UPI0039B0BC3F